MRRLALVLAPAIAAAFVACSTPTFHRASRAPQLAPSADIVVVDRAPVGAVLLGTAAVQANVNTTLDECQASALTYAKNAGATHAIMRLSRPGTAKNGPRCVAEAYYLAPR